MVGLSFGEIHCVVGDDAYRRDEILSGLRKKLIPEGMASLAHVRLQSPDIGTLLEQLQQVAMGLVPVQVIEVADFDPMAHAVPDSDKPYLKALIAELEDLSPTKALILVSTKASKAVSFTKTVSKLAHTTWHECASFAFWQADQAEGELIRLAKTKGMALTPAAAEMLVENYGVQLQPLMQEVAKLWTFTSGKPVQPEHVALLSTHQNHTFHMLEDWVHQRQALRRLTTLEEILLSEAPQRLLALMQGRLQYWFLLRYFQRHRLSSGEMAQRLKAKPFKITKDLEALGQVTYDRLKTLRNQTLQMEWDVKRGRMNAQQALEALLTM